MLDLNKVKQYIAQEIRDNGSDKNIFLQTKKIKMFLSSNGDIDNADIFAMLSKLENLQLIEITQVACSEKLYTNRKTWTRDCYKFENYMIDVKKSEYFDVDDWAIKIEVDKENLEFKIWLRGVENPIVKKFNRGKNNSVSKTLEYFLFLQEHSGKKIIFDESEKSVKLRYDTIQNFVHSICPNLNKLLFKWGSCAYNVVFSKLISYDVLKAYDIKELIFFKNTDKAQKYQCKIDETENVIRWGLV